MITIINKYYKFRKYVLLIRIFEGMRLIKISLKLGVYFGLKRKYYKDRKKI
jgi:hypothetical protein